MIFLPATVHSQAGAVPASVDSVASLRRLPLTGLTTGSVVRLTGYYAAGDIPEVGRVLAASPCSLQNGLGDGGEQIPASSPGHCWLLTPQQAYDPRWWGAVEDKLPGEASLSKGSPNLTLSEPGDWKNGQSVLIIGAGTPISLAAAAVEEVVPSAVSGSTTYCYRVAAIDAAGGVGVASPELCSSKGPTELGMAADLGAPNQGMKLTIKLPKGARAVAIYQGAPGAEKFRAVFDGSSPTWIDYGHGSAGAPQAHPPAGAVGRKAKLKTMNAAGGQIRPFWIPELPPATPQNDWMRTTIISGASTLNLVVAANAEATLTQAIVLHDSTAPLAALAATGHTITLPCGTFNTTQTLVITAEGQSLNGSGMGCSILQGFGAQDIVSVGDGVSANSGGGINDVTLDATEEAAGNGFLLDNQLRTNFNRVEIENAYNCLAMGRTTFSQLNVIRCSTDERGQYTAHLYGLESVNQTTYLHQLQNAVSYTAVGFHVDGDVASFFLYDSAIQKTPYKQYVVDNAIGSRARPSLLQTFNTGFNFCSDLCIDEEVGSQIKWIRTYSQSVRGAGTGSIYIAPGVKNTTITDSDVFGADKPCIEDHGFVTVISDSAVYACSRPANTAASIQIGAEAEGVSISGVGGFNLSGTGATATTAKALINIEAGAKYVQIGPLWGATGQSCDVIDNQGSPEVTIEGLPAGSPPTTVLAHNGSVTLTTAAFPNLYKGVGGAIAKYCRSTGNPNAFTDTTDSASNIVAFYKHEGYSVLPGFQFLIRLVNAANATMTLAGGSGVSINGIATTSATGHPGATVRHDILCTVTSVSPATVRCHG
ncbi:MAG: hypothetical protein V4555_05020 [Acidobacteriota bacterium]